MTAREVAFELKNAINQNWIKDDIDVYIVDGDELTHRVANFVIIKGRPAFVIKELESND
jgi:hypothetical protein